VRDYGTGVVVAAFVLVAQVGCDQVFQLDRGAELVDGGSDACWDPLLQGNEDQDGFVDGCDPCPADPDATIVNGDRDDLGDACDPRRMEGAQTYVTFDGFETAGPWQPRTGTWSFSGGELAQTATGVNARIEAPITATRHPGADLQLTSTSTSGQLGGYFLFGAAVEVACIYEFRNDPTPDRFALFVNNVTAAQTDVAAAGSIRIRLFQDAEGRFHCRGTRGLTEVAELTASSPLLMDTSARIGLFASGTATFQALSVFATE
jgi:hypothetical protein